jgi:hypothetical protein
MLQYLSKNQNTVTTIPAITYLFVGLTSFVLAYFTAMDKDEETEELPKEESATEMLPGLDSSSNENNSETDTPPNAEEEPGLETESEDTTEEKNEQPISGGKKRKHSVKKRAVKKISKRATKSRAT